MELGQAGIIIECRCGGAVAAEINDVLFDNRGQVKVGHRPLCCAACGAIYRYGERLKYKLGPLDTTRSNRLVAAAKQPLSSANGRPSTNGEEPLPPHSR